MKWGALRVLVAWLLCCNYCVVDRSTASLECPAKAETSPEARLRDLGGLAPMVSSAKSTRNGIIADDLPYNFISTQAGEAYNNGTLNTKLFMNHWTSYTQNALFLGGFVLFVGILLPGVMVALWTFWECCYEEDEEEEEDNRNLTLQAQLVVWGLAGVLVAMVIVLVILVGILLVGNAWISQGVERGKEIAWHTIPQLTEMRDSALHTLDSTVVGGYKNLTHQLQSNLLNQVSLNVTLTVSSTYNSSVNQLHHEVKTHLSLHPHLLTLTHNLTHLLLSTLPSLTDGLTRSLTELERQCNLTLAMEQNATAITEPLLAQCQDFASNPSPYLPQPEVGLGGLGADGQLLLSQLEQLLSNDVFELESGPLPWQLFQTYLEELDTNLSLRINITSDRHLAALGSNLSNFVVEVATFYNSSLSLASQPRVEEYLGSRYLENWEWFRSALTMTFAVLVFLGMLLLLLSVGRGLYNVTATYCYAEETAYDHGAHQAGVTIKKLTFSFLLVCILSAAFSCFFLSVAGVLGKVCGSHSNFSELVANVVDNPSTWGGRDSPQFPLARVILEEPRFPLTVGGLLEACGTNLSLFQALHLEQRYDLEERLMLSPQDKKTYREEMRNVSVYLNRATLVSMATEMQLQYLANASAIPVLWAELTSLSPATVYQPPFVGLPQLKEMLEEMSTAAEDSDSFHNLSTALHSSMSALRELEDNLQTTLSTVNSTAIQLHSNLSVIAPSLSLSLSSLAGNITITAASSSNQLVTIVAQQVNRQLELFLNMTTTTLTCHLGSCYQLAKDYEDFASATCGDVVPGMDIYWTSLMIILAVSLLIMPLSLLLASRFISLEMEKSNRKNPNFYLVGAIMRQVRGSLWFIFSLSVYLWWVVYVSHDEDLHERFCSGSQAACCDKCVWVFGIIFLFISVGVGGVSRAYQYFTIYMIKKCKAMKYRRFWIERKKAVNFYGQLGLFFLQDLPFLILAGTYANNVFLNVPTFYCLGVSLIGILTYITYLIRERQNIFNYWTWLKMELAKLSSAKTFNNQEPMAQVGNGTGTTARRGTSLPNGHAHQVRSPYASSGSDHSEDSSQGTYQEHGFEFHPPRLSDIPEYPEGGLEAAAAAVGGVTRAVVEPHPQEDDGQTDTEMSERHSQFQSRVRLDRDVDFDSDAYMQRRREAIEQFVRGGVEVAPAHYRNRDLETSTISDSYYYGSRDSVELQEYYSSSQAPDTNSYYESSDYREEDCESEYSQAKYRLPLGGFMGEVTVDV